jgi:hypothetical protein
MWNFSNTLFKSFSVQSSAKGSIFWDKTLEEVLVVARHNILSIYSIRKELLEIRKEIELFCHIKAIKRLPSSNPQRSDTFFILTDDLAYTFCNLDEGEIVSRSQGEILYPSTSIIENDTFKIISDTDQASYVKDYSFSGQKYLAVHIYKEYLTIFPFRYQEGEINIKVEKGTILRLSLDNIIDIISMDPKLYT